MFRCKNEVYTENLTLPLLIASISLFSVEIIWILVKHKFLVGTIFIIGSIINIFFAWHLIDNIDYSLKYLPNRYFRSRAERVRSKYSQRREETYIKSFILNLALCVASLFLQKTIFGTTRFQIIMFICVLSFGIGAFWRFGVFFTKHGRRYTTIFEN